MSATKSAEKLLFETPAIKINRKGLFPGSGMLNTLIHLTSHCYFTNKGTVNYTGLMIEPVTGEYECDLHGLDFLIKNCNGTKKEEKVKDSIDLLIKNSIIEIDCKENRHSVKSIRFKLNKQLKQFFPKVNHNPTMSAATQTGYFSVMRNLYTILPDDYELTKTDVFWDICTSICYNDDEYPDSKNTVIAVFKDKNSAETKSLFTYEELAQRWHWSGKSRVSQFFDKYNQFFETATVGRKSRIILKDNLLYSGLFYDFVQKEEEFKSLADYVQESKIFRNEKLKKRDLFSYILALANENELTSIPTNKAKENTSKEENEKLKTENKELKEEITKVKKENADLKKENKKIKEERAQLREKVYELIDEKGANEQMYHAYMNDTEYYT